MNKLATLNLTDLFTLVQVLEQKQDMANERITSEGEEKKTYNTLERNQHAVNLSKVVTEIEIRIADIFPLKVTTAKDLEAAQQ